jgi:N6-L-threonylcarbamoyladenine synthase/N6-L-threonylcarbamoyladenine synthase/protein kinase Bud32
VGIIEATSTEYRILANEINMYSPAQGGIHPREAANHHAQHIATLIRDALSKAKLTFEDINLVAFSQGPGLGPCLRTVATAARALALTLNIPILGVNHCVAHLELGDLLGCTDPILLYVSGGNTQVIAYVRGKYRVFGETLDIGIGNMLDKFGLAIGLRFPPAPAVEKLAKSGTKYLQLPYSVKGMDVAFSGILTAALQLIRKGARIEDVCYSIQEVCFAMLTEVTERAMAHTEKDEVLLGGGVAQNRRLQAMVRDMAHARNTKFYVPPNELCADNGAMIAYTGLKMYEGGVRMYIKDTVVKQRFRTDDVDVCWR